MRYVLSIFFFFLLIPLNINAEEIISKNEILTLQRCIEIATKLHPNILAAKNNVIANEKRIPQVKSNYYPQITWSSSYRRSYQSFDSSGYTMGKNNDTIDQYSSTFGLNQLLYDFGKTSTNVEIHNLYLDASTSDFENQINQIVYNVKEAYFKVLQAKRNKEVAIESVKQFQQHLEQAEGFYKVGTKPKFDVTKAEVDLSNARLNLIKAENAYKLSIVNLNNAMGITYAPEYSIEDILTSKKIEITFEDALNNAYKNRPDLKSIVLKRQTAEKTIELIKKDYYPLLTANASYGWSGETFPLEHGWNVGASLSFPIFSGFLTKYQLEEAKANLNVIKANEESLKQSIFLEVQQAYLNLKDAEERIPTAELNVKQAEENFEIANGRYIAGVGNPIEVTDANVALVNARTAYIQALYDYKIAISALERAMGVR